MPDGSTINFSRRKVSALRNAKASRKPQFLDGVGFLGGLLGQSAGIFVGVTALTYFFGWRVQTAYYAEIGAPWAVETLPPFSFLMAGAILSFMTLTGLLVGVPGIQQSGRTKSVSYLNYFICVLALALMFAGDFSLVSEVQALKFGQATTMLFFLSCGLTLSELAFELSRSNFKWTDSALSMVTTGVLLAANIGPGHLGLTKAKLHILNIDKELPLVVLPDEKGPPSWRLVQPIGENALLLRKAQPPALGYTFRLIETKELETIQSITEKERQVCHSCQP